jgi:hypothetical protein
MTGTLNSVGGLSAEPFLYTAAFIADARGLDFLNSIATQADVEIDSIERGEGWLAWLGQASLVPEPVLDAFRPRALPGELDAVAAQARSLREWFRALVARHIEQPLTTNAPLRDAAVRGYRIDIDRLRPFKSVTRT